MIWLTAPLKEDQRCALKQNERAARSRQRHPLSFQFGRVIFVYSAPSGLPSRSLCFRRYRFVGNLDFPGLACFGFGHRQRYFQHAIAELRFSRVNVDAFGKWYSAIEVAVASFTTIIAVIAFFTLLLSLAVNGDCTIGEIDLDVIVA